MYLNFENGSIKCPCCDTPDGGFVYLNNTADYSGIHIEVNKQGMLRVRVFDADDNFVTQDIVQLPYCPICGRTF